MLTNLGKIIGLFAAHEAHSIIAHSEIDVFYAPSECHNSVAEHNSRQLALLEKQLGVSYDEAIAEGERRTDPNTMKRYYDHCVSKIIYRDHPMLEERDRSDWD